jgi:AcrR family transcriptional regulator
MTSSVSYKEPSGLHSGRSGQKLRTRQKLVAAARDLVLQGRPPTLLEAAAAAGISPATAYRYFPDQLRLLGEALKDAGPSMRARVPGDIDQSEPASHRITIAAEGFFRQAIERERLIRAVMALSLLRSVDTDPEARQEAVSVRPGLRRMWIEKALATEARTLPPAKYRRLNLALNALISTESLVVLQDLCGATAQEAADTCAWASRILVNYVLHTEQAILAAMPAEDAPVPAPKPSSLPRRRTGAAGAPPRKPKPTRRARKSGAR